MSYKGPRYKKEGGKSDYRSHEYHRVVYLRKNGLSYSIRSQRIIMGLIRKRDNERTEDLDERALEF